MVVHDARADGREISRHAGADGGHDAAGFVARDDGSAGAQSQGGGGVTDGAVGVQVAAAHAGGFDGEDDLAGSRYGIGEFLQLELSLSEKDDAAHMDEPSWLTVGRFTAAPPRRRA